MADDSDTFDGNELSAFVKATLEAISSGIRQASAAVESTVHGDDTGYHAFAGPKSVSFDIAVSVRREAAKGGGLKLEVFSIGGSYDGKSSAHSETVTRISFEIPWQHRLTDKGNANFAAGVKNLGRGMV